MLQASDNEHKQMFYLFIYLLLLLLLLLLLFKRSKCVCVYGSVAWQLGGDRCKVQTSVSRLYTFG